jgi:hypothetical protein
VGQSIRDIRDASLPEDFVREEKRIDGKKSAVVVSNIEGCALGDAFKAPKLKSVVGFPDPVDEI